MFKRIIKTSSTHSFFLFGARSTGKSTHLHELHNADQTLWLDLLDTELEERLSKDPQILKALIKAEPNKKWVVIDEIQKIPELLNVIHQLSKNKNIKFALTGSSARKLKRGAANLLAGRAFNYICHPLTHVEMGDTFNLLDVLKYGSLPEILSLKTEDKIDFLRAYIDIYFKEEIVAEQFIRKLKPFKSFLQVAAQMNGKTLNLNKIARDVDVDHTTIQNYFEILEDTLVGFQLEPYHQSIRKRQRKSSKFYFFDLGVTRALQRRLELPISEESYEYGNAFEHFLILEFRRLRDYLKPDWGLYYLRTKDDAEIDLIIERPGLKKIAIEIKSSQRVDDIRDASTQSFKALAEDLSRCDRYVLSNDHLVREVDGIRFIHWKKGIQEIYGI
jgi:predicted AAA+ superfamily ATPase